MRMSRVRSRSGRSLRLSNSIRTRTASPLDQEALAVARELAAEFAREAAERDHERRLPAKELDRFSGSGLWANHRAEGLWWSGGFLRNARRGHRDHLRRRPEPGAAPAKSSGGAGCDQSDRERRAKAPVVWPRAAGLSPRQRFFRGQEQACRRLRNNGETRRRFLHCEWREVLRDRRLVRPFHPHRRGRRERQCPSRDRATRDARTDDHRQLVKLRPTHDGERQRSDRQRSRRARGRDSRLSRRRASLFKRVGLADHPGGGGRGHCAGRNRGDDPFRAQPCEALDR